MRGLLRCVEDRSTDVVSFEAWIVLQDLFDRGIMRQEFQDVGHADSLSADAGPPAALAAFHRDALEKRFGHSDILNRSGPFSPPHRHGGRAHLVATTGFEGDNLPDPGEGLGYAEGCGGLGGPAAVLADEVRLVCGADQGAFSVPFDPAMLIAIDRWSNKATSVFGWLESTLHEPADGSGAVRLDPDQMTRSICCWLVVRQGSFAHDVFHPSPPLV